MIFIWLHKWILLLIHSPVKTRTAIIANTIQKSILGFEVTSDHWRFLKTMKNVFYFMLKALFVLEMFKFLSWLYGFVKRLHRKAKINFEIHDITFWTTNNFNTYIVQYLIRTKDNQAMKLGKLIKYNVRNISPHTSRRNGGKEAYSRPLFVF